MAIAAHKTHIVSQLQTLRNVFTADDLNGFVLAEEFLYPATDGISLLDVKNELVLAYLQSLVHLMILKLRIYAQSDSKMKHEAVSLISDATSRLVELRVYTEKGVRPLEGRLRYQIDKVLKAADDSEKAYRRKDFKPRQRKERSNTAGDIRASDSVAHEDSSSQTSQYDLDISSSSPEPIVDDLSYRPNPASLLRKGTTKPMNTTRQNALANRTAGAYRPPRIQPAAMSEPDRRVERHDRGPRKSALVDEYVVSELSSAPLPEPSVGAGNMILDRGRNAMGRRERADEKERRTYEEANFVRLPGESKADKRKRNRMDRFRGRRDEYGGEDWSGLGGLGDRIARVTGGDKGSGSLLQRSRKRTVSSTGRDDNAGLGVGEAFEKRRKVLQDREARRKRKG